MKIFGEYNGPIITDDFKFTRLFVNVKLVHVLRNYNGNWKTWSKIADMI